MYVLVNFSAFNTLLHIFICKPAPYLPTVCIVTLVFVLFNVNCCIKGTQLNTESLTQG